MQKLNKQYALIMVLAFCFFATQVYRPIDNTSLNIWREADVGSMTRNFAEESMNIFYPRIDWRGAGPGFVESEFPFQAWIGSLFYLTFGAHEWFLRFISLLAMMGSCVVFSMLARILLSEKAAILATLIFVMHPMIYMMSTAIQPEPIMLFPYIAAIYCFITWIQTDQFKFYIWALLATTAAILVKIPAAHIAILFFLLSINHFGIKALYSPKLIFFALFSLGVPLVWYDHARSLWEQYGNSLGISNEAYARMSRTNFSNFIEKNIIGNLVIEINKIWMGVGCILGVIGLYSLVRKNEAKIFLYWGISLVAYFLVSGGTTGEKWATYYHIVTIPFASLLMAQGFYFLFAQKKILAQGLICTLFGMEIGYYLYANLIKQPPSPENYLSAKEFQPLLSGNNLIVTNGNATTDDVGRLQGANAPYYFYWLHRKGFTLYENLQTMENLMQLKKEGADYFIIERRFVDSNPAFYKQVFEKFPVLDETNSAILVDLRG